MRRKSILMATIVFALLPATAFAKRGEERRNQKGSNGAVKLEAELFESDAVNDVLDGEASYRAQPSVKGEIEKFEVELQIPFPNSLFASQVDALAAELELTLSRKGVAYAKCILDPEEEDDDDSSFARSARSRGDDDDDDNVAPANPSVEFKLELKKKIRRSRVRLEESRGVCDLDLTVDGIQSGIPKVVRGDVIEINLLKGTESLLIVDGRFRRHR